MKGFLYIVNESDSNLRRSDQELLSYFCEMNDKINAGDLFSKRKQMNV